VVEDEPVPGGGAAGAVVCLGGGEGFADGDGLAEGDAAAVEGSGIAAADEGWADAVTEMATGPGAGAAVVAPGLTP